MNGIYLFQGVPPSYKLFYRYITYKPYLLIGLRETLQENPMIFMGKSGWFPVKIFPSTNPLNEWDILIDRHITPFDVGIAMSWTTQIFDGEKASHS